MEEKPVNDFNDSRSHFAINQSKNPSTFSTFTVSNEGTILNHKPKGEDYVAAAVKKTRASLDLRDWMIALILFYLVALLI
jgi:outer membrane lipoprotein-sorting protein